MKEPEPTLVITPDYTNAQYFRSLIEYRELFLFLCWRDILVRYKQTFLGIAWALIRPALMMIILTLIFGRVAKLPVEGAAPYALMVIAGLLPWQLFAATVQQGSESLINNSQIIGKIFFPRVIFPVSAAMTALVDSLVALVILFAMMAWYQFMPDWRIVFLPFFMALGILAALGLAMLVSVLNVWYRDFRHIMPFVLQIGMFASPVGFSSSVVPEQYKLLYAMNPMVGVIDGYRWSILGNDIAIYWPGFILSIALTALLVTIGFTTFRHFEGTLADRI